MGYTEGHVWLFAIGNEKGPNPKGELMFCLVVESFIKKGDEEAEGLESREAEEGEGRAAWPSAEEREESRWADDALMALAASDEEEEEEE
ncbi:hypothetical protein L1049_009388 [Liquidambar formosana]|uniref:Uncharacterized protein n=1 Tax=Liquidambar formosana TaxID=63359 RepID=A0AAP0SB66_LIQFO